MKVYAVIWDMDYEDHKTVAIYSTKEKAEAWVDKNQIKRGDMFYGQARYEVEEFEVDEDWG